MSINSRATSSLALFLSTKQLVIHNNMHFCVRKFIKKGHLASFNAVTHSDIFVDIQKLDGVEFVDSRPSID